MAPRAVPLYNAAHRLVGPAVGLPISLLVGAPVLRGIGLTWLSHARIDRALGYGLRKPDGYPRVHFQREEIVRAARELLGSEGPSVLSMQRPASQLGIQAPSLHKHVPDKTALKAQIIAEGPRELCFRAAPGSDDVVAKTLADRVNRAARQALRRCLSHGGAAAAAQAAVADAAGRPPRHQRQARSVCEAVVEADLESLRGCRARHVRRQSSRRDRRRVCFRAGHAQGALREPGVAPDLLAVYTQPGQEAAVRV